MSIFSKGCKTVDRLSNLFAHVAMWSVLALMLIVVVDVFMRAVVNRSILITEEMGGYLLVIIAYLGMAETLKQGRHVSVDFVSRRLPGKFRAWMELGLSLIGLMALLVVIWRSVVMVYGSYAGNVIIPGIFLTPVYLPQILVDITRIRIAAKSTTSNRRGLSSIMVLIPLLSFQCLP